MSVAVTHRHDLIRDGLIAIITGADGLEVVAARPANQAPVGVDADVLVVDGDAYTGADVVLADGDNSAPQDLLELVNAASPTRVLVLVSEDRGDFVVASRLAGAAGIAAVSDGRAEIVSAIAAVAEGGSWYPERSSSPIATTTRERWGLTRRELDVLQLLASGRSVTEIAEELYLSVHTVRNHVRAVLAKLDARSQLDAVVRAVRAGVIAIV